VLNKLIIRNCDCGSETSVGEKAVKHTIFSDGVKTEWKDPEMWDKLIKKIPFIFEKPKQQII